MRPEPSWPISNGQFQFTIAGIIFFSQADLMTRVDIDFHHIRPHRGTRDHGFEELCTQLAYLENRPASALYYRKGIGADAGLECFVRHADESETGWQAKYFSTFDASQQQQLDESIEHALEKHPQLTRFIVCLPFNLRDARRGKKKTELQRWDDWVKKWEGIACTKKRKLVIERWDEAALVERLTRKDPRYEGRIAYWFDQAILTPQWFKDRFDQARAGLGERYTPETNVELPIRRTLLSFCRDPSVFDEIETWAQKIEEARHQAIDDIERIKRPDVLGDALVSLESASTALLRLLNAVSPDPSFLLPIEQLKARARDTLKAVSACEAVIWHIHSEKKNETGHSRDGGYHVRKFDHALSDFVDEMENERWAVANSRQLLVYGDAGVGKSHLFGDAAEHQVSRERPALLILGGTLREAEPWSQIIEHVGLHGISSDTLLGALDAAGQAAGVRTAIFVDAINERHGIDLWSTRLAPFLKTIARFPHVAVALSCRSTYLPYIIEAKAGLKDLLRIEHVGFAGNASAARYYLDKRGIVRMAAPNLLPEFNNPLFLKTCCDFLIRTGQREFPRGLRGVTSIFEFYSQAVAQTIEQRMKLDFRQKIVMRALSELAAAFDEGERGYVEREEAHRLLENIRPSDGLYERSLLSQLENEGVVAIEPVDDDVGAITEMVRFSFERYSDHRIAHRLLEQHFKPDEPQKSFVPGAPLRAYIEHDDAYERAGVIEALATQLPERCGQELQDLLGSGTRRNHLLSNAIVQSALWRNQEHFSSRTLELLEEASRFSGRDEARNTLIAIATEPDNQFNADYLHDRLMRLSMPDRDQAWSSYLMREQDDEDSNVETLIAWIAANGGEPIDERRAELAAITLSWVFTVSNRSMRDRATKALSELLSLRLQIAARLIMRFAEVNDPYVLERVLAAAYGGALQGLSRNGLGALAEAAYHCVFAPDPPLVHILIRDYARGIVELAAQHDLLPAGVSIEKARPPYGSPWPLEEVSKSLIETYKQNYGRGEFSDEIVSSAVNDGDFARYVIDSNVTSWSRLPISLTGLTSEAVFDLWMVKATALHPEVVGAVEEITTIFATMSEVYERLGAKAQSIKFPFVDDDNEDQEDADGLHPEARAIEEALASAEERLRAIVGEELWQDYQLKGKPHLYGDIRWRPYNRLRPPPFDTGHARRWVCKRAHDLGWTPERFGEFERNMRSSSGRMEHRIERIGKKYQWLALYELLASLADSQMFIGRYGSKPSWYEGPWEISARNIDPSLLVARTHDDGWRSWHRTWWMPIEIKLKPINTAARLRWLHGPDDFLKDHTLINVDDPKTGRRWTVLHEVVAWRDWAMRNGDRQLERTTWFRLQCVLVKAQERAALIRALTSRMVTDDDDIPKIEMPWRAFIGEYPWHPVFRAIDGWDEPRYRLPGTTQPAVTSYQAERGGYDYSIEESLDVDLPSPALVRGLGLRLSNGRTLSYSDATGVVQFFDPSVNEEGPGAALVDHDAFLAFLKREGLEAVWIIGGMKSVHGGRKHREGWGGDRLFSSVFWETDEGFQRRDRFEERKPSREQLERLFASD
jgi:hypothetical protein